MNFTPMTPKQQSILDRKLSQIYRHRAAKERAADEERHRRIALGLSEEIEHINNKAIPNAVYAAVLCAQVCAVIGCLILLWMLIF
jgi:hypothetical protein